VGEHPYRPAIPSVHPCKVSCEEFGGGVAEGVDEERPVEVAVASFAAGLLRVGRRGRRCRGWRWWRGREYARLEAGNPSDPATAAGARRATSPWWSLLVGVVTVVLSGAAQPFAPDSSDARIVIIGALTGAIWLIFANQHIPPAWPGSRVQAKAWRYAENFVCLFTASFGGRLIAGTALPRLPAVVLLFIVVYSAAAAVLTLGHRVARGFLTARY
jgi:hypothetical protein